MCIVEFTNEKDNLGGTTGALEDRIQVVYKPKFVKDLIKKIREKISAAPVQEQLTTEIQEKDWQQSRIRIMFYNASLTGEGKN